MRIITTIIAISVAISLSAQGIKGRITNERNEPVSYANIFISSIKTCTAANVGGFYEFKLKNRNRIEVETGNKII